MNIETIVLTENNRSDLLNYSIVTRKSIIDAIIEETLVEKKDIC